MISPIKNIARSASKQESLNILSFICDGYFDSMLCEALPQHNFYGPINDGNKPSGWNFTLCPQPNNFHYIANINQSNIVNKINFDLIICHDRTSQYDIARQFAQALHINTIIVEHIVNTTHLDLISMIPLLKKTKNDINVFIEDITEQFKIPGTIIKYGIPNLKHNNRDDKKNQILVLNLDQPTVDSIQPHISTPIVLYDINNLNPKQYYSLLQKSKFYFNMSAEITRLQLPVLHAMSAGCVVVSMSSPVINNLITHMKNGIIINGMEDLLEVWKNIDNIDTKKISQNANQYIMDNYDPEQFKQQWQNIITLTAKQTYVR